MLSRLEAVPAEVLDSILEYLINHDIGTLRGYHHMHCATLSRLSQCSRFLFNRLEPLLYATLDARNAALRKGCMTGSLHLIRKVASYGANLACVQRPMHSRTGYVEVCSLQFALRAGQLEAFLLLLDLGVGLTPHDYIHSGTTIPDRIANSHLRSFAQRLAEPRSVAFLTAFLEARKETPYRKDNRSDKRSQAQAVVSHLPFPNIVRWASPTLLATLLDNGAHVEEAVILSHVGPEKHVVPEKKNQPLTPLGAACLRGGIDVFNLLVARGAQVDIDDSLRSKYPNRSTHIPIFLAAHYMAVTGDTSMLDACIAGGADVNRPCHIHETPSPEEYTLRKATHVCTAPFLTYLGSIESWDNASPSVANKNLAPSEGVAYFIHSLGVNVAGPVAAPIKRKYCNPDEELHDRTFGGISSPVELLLVKWGIESLAIPEFFSLIKLLIEHGGLGHDPARILVRFDGQNKPSSREAVDLEYLWGRFLELVMLQVRLLDLDSKNALLRRVMTDKARMRNRVAHPSRWIKVRAIGRASISALVRAGADINRLGGPQWDKRTPLHELISSFIHTDNLTRDFLHDHPQGETCEYTSDVIESFGDFLAFLVSEGADPMVEDTRGVEKTVIDTLLSPMKEGRLRNEGGTVEKGLVNLVARVQGGSRMIDYTGERKPYQACRYVFGSGFMGYYGGCEAPSEEDTIG